jgi:PelA/Pel-15E family pectate lyase
LTGALAAPKLEAMPAANPLSQTLLTLPLLALLHGQSTAVENPALPLRWKDVLRQPAAWYQGPEAARIAGNVLLYQRTSGGWPKNQEMAAALPPAERERIAGHRDTPDSTIDNSATTTQLRFLARVHSANPRGELRDAILRGVDYLLDMQYPNGGWPQYWPKPKGYAAHITFNDGAMVNVLALAREIASGRDDLAFVDAARRERAAAAVTRGIECLLRCQVVVDGRPTVWCAQHDERTLAPAAARSYEHPSLSGGESVGLTRFLMNLETPEPRVVQAVEAAVAWFEASRLRGLRIVEKPDASLAKGYDKVVVEDPSAPPLWARFYDLRSGRPIFSGRDGVIKARLADIEHERRVGYAWYTEAPAALLAKDLPAWRARIGSGTRAGAPRPPN